MGAGVVTRNQVARLAGTSSAVVSYVVNNGPRPVAAATRTRVLAAIDELGYRPNGLARALKVRRTLALGLVVPDSSNPFFAELARVIEDAAYQHGYTLLVGNAADDDQRETSYVRAFGERQMDGLLLISSEGSRSVVEELDHLRAAVVVVDRFLPGVQAATIVADNQGGGRAATAHLIGHGHVRIACLAGPSDLTPSADRHRGWARALAEAGLDPEPGLLLRGRFDRLAGYQATRRLLGQSRPPTALFASTDTQAIGALKAVADAGRRVPDDLAIASFDGIAESAYTIPGLTTVQQPIELMGRRAIDRLLDRLHAPQGPPTAEVLPVQLLLRGSCGCREPPGPLAAPAEDAR